MRIDLCRKCGQELQVMQLCNNCNQPLHFECSNCTVFVDDPIHQHNYLLDSPLQQNGVMAKFNEVKIVPLMTFNDVVTESGKLG